MRSCRAGLLVVVLPLLTLWPALALAQQPKAGVVTTLQGQATVARAALPQPLPIKFKDDVFRQDQIDTREDSVVRVLLGGKALVTIRELSTFTVTEEPGRAVVDLKTGKLALAVAKQLLRPGETVEVRTPHAIAAVRGSLSVIQVTNVTQVWHLQGTPLELFTPARVPITSVDPGQKISASAAAVGAKQSIPPGEAKEVAKTSEAPKPKEQSDKAAGGESIGEAKMKEAAELATQLAPAEVKPTTSTLTSPTPTTETSTSDIGVQAQSATKTAQESAAAGNLVKNEGFETGDLTNWTLSGAGKVISQFGSNPIKPAAGSFMFLGHTGSGAVSDAGCASGQPCQTTKLSQAFDVKSVLNISFKYVLLSKEVNCPSGASCTFKTDTGTTALNDRWRVRLIPSSGSAVNPF